MVAKELRAQCRHMISVALLLLCMALSACTSQTSLGLKTYSLDAKGRVAQAASAAYSTCPPKPDSRCAEMVNARYEQFAVYFNHFMNSTDLAAERIGRLTTQTEKFANQCSAGNNSGCRSAAFARSEFQRSSNDYVRQVDRYRTVEDATVEAILAVPAWFKNADIRVPKWICKVYNSGLVLCASTMEFAGSLKEELGWMFLESLDTIAAEVDPNSTSNVVVSCGFGAWTTAKLPTEQTDDDASSSNDSAQSANESRRTIIQACRDDSKSLGGPASTSWIMNAGNFDPSFGECIVDAAADLGSISTRDVVDTMLDVTQRLAKFCKSNPLANSGTDDEWPDCRTSPPGEPCRDPYGISQGSILDKYHQDSDSSNNNHPPLADIPPCLVNPDTSSCSKTNNDGSTTEYRENDDGTTQRLTKYPDGSVLEQNIDAPGGNSQKKYYDSSGQLIYQRNCTSSGCTEETASGDQITYDEKGNMVSWEQNGETVCDNDEEGNECSQPEAAAGNSANNCPDPESCNTCGSAGTALKQFGDACLDGGGSDPRCGGYFAAKSCCASGEKPGFLVPNPVDWECSREESSGRNARCKKFCEYSDDPEECEQKCINGATDIQRTIFEDFCELAYWDGCSVIGPTPELKLDVDAQMLRPDAFLLN